GLDHQSLAGRDLDRLPDRKLLRPGLRFQNFLLAAGQREPHFVTGARLELDQAAAVFVVARVEPQVQPLPPLRAAGGPELHARRVRAAAALRTPVEADRVERRYRARRRR